MPKTVKEGKASISFPPGVFYNAEMELCRDLTSLCLGSLKGELSVADAMCASGIRGIRYALENENVSSLTLSDQSVRAIASARANAKKNRVRCHVVKSDANELLQQNAFDFVELDPFGSPAPFLHSSAISLSEKKLGYLSVTATDMAVLCGAAHSACLRNYGAIPLDNECCHENAVRILAGKVMLECSQFNVAARPIFTLSHRHYIKMVFETRRSAELATGAVKSLGFVSYCPSCCYRSTARLVLEQHCPHCKHILEHAGPLARGSLWDVETLKSMLSLNAKRNYGKKMQAEKMLSTMVAECGVGAYGYYDLHVLAKKTTKRIMPIDEALERIRGAGFAAERTHFAPTAVRTDAPHEKVLGLAVA